MQEHKHIYSFNYPANESELCKLEARHIFHAEENNKLLFSDIKIDPSSSAFIKKRFDILLCSNDFDSLIDKIKSKKIQNEGFKIEYLVLDGDKTEYKDRLERIRKIGYSIESAPDYYNPTIMFGLCYYKEIWYFGTLIKNSFEWHKHKQKPFSFSNAINMNIAKTLVNIASQGNKKNTLIDACCGVGTAMLEGCFSGFDIEGCDINWKTYRHTKKNMEHFGYTANVHLSDIKDIHQKYDAAIIDLPYNLYAYSDDEITNNIIGSTAKISNRIVIVSIADIEEIILNSGLKISDFCTIKKMGSQNFTRKIWLCEKS